ncbi:hypothetical protein RINTU1_23530 [Candidatus Regiella insecticola]|uniref:Uncharacterized protein n=1 Tax=Candidatus Regiella insecticola TaxID=138073 RepID=A0A6L2ZPD4_9ENTR|nr:hypothetical protein RINTU1_23530 [Candidatus Regiella insecticola]
MIYRYNIPFIGFKLKIFAEKIKFIFKIKISAELICADF